MENYFYRCSSGEHRLCEKLYIKDEAGKDPDALLENTGHTKCWKCGNGLVFVEKK